MFELFKFNDSDQCDTLNLIMKRDGLKFQETPTNLRHIKGYLQSEACKSFISGITMNSHLYTSDNKNSVKKDDMDEQVIENDII